MARCGFIHDKLDIKLLILYILARVSAPLDFASLTDLTMIDEGIDYFEFAEALSELVGTDHVDFADGLYSITEKGRKNGAACESSLAYSVRNKCLQHLTKLNAALRRSSQVRSAILPRDDGTCTLRLSLDDETGNVLTLDLLSPSEEQAAHLSAGFKQRPEQVYNAILDVLLAASSGGDSKGHPPRSSDKGGSK